MYKIIGADGQQYGPVSVEQIRRWIAENRARGDTLIQPEGTQEWKPLSSFPDFAKDLPPTPPPPTSDVPPPLAPLRPASSATASERASNKVPAGVCGILLGSLGVHKFILGYTGTGVIMLVVTLVGGIFTCGISSGVMHIIGLIEGILYLTKSDDEFVRTYVDGTKEWF
jgi:TM2 domain-containing membrane protein YozV